MTLGGFMPTFPVSEMVFVGAFAGPPNDRPILCDAILQHQPTGLVFSELDATPEDGGFSVDDRATFEDINRFLDAVQDACVTVLPRPVHYREDARVLAWKRIHVASHASVQRCRQRYGRIETIRGDACLRATDALAALTFYERVAAVLQNPPSYARMLMCPLPKDREERIRKFLVERHPDRESREAEAIIAETMEHVRREIFP